MHNNSNSKKEKINELITLEKLHNFLHHDAINHKQSYYMYVIRITA